MILLVGSNKDRVIKYLAEFLINNQKPVVFLNQNKIFDSVLVFNNFFKINSIEYPYDKFTGVLNRIVNVAQNVSCKRIPRALSLLSCVINTKLNNVINRVQYCASNDSKLYQITTLTKKDIRIPKSQVLAKTSLSKLQDVKYIFKSLGSIRSIVTEHEHHSYQNTLTYEPVLFQELILGENIRVHVIKNICFATLIKSEKIDYRYDYDKRVFLDYNLPKIIQEECLLIAKNMSLTFCGIDLIKYQGFYYILEVNPSPGYSFYEKNLSHQDISKALMNALSNL